MIGAKMRPNPATPKYLMEATLPKITPDNLRSRKWFANPENPEMTALYLERYLNYGLTREELQSGKPIIAIAQTGSDLSPCNRHHLELTKRVRDGIIAAGERCWKYLCIRYRKRANGQLQCWTVTWPICRWWKPCSGIRWTGLF